MHRVHPDHPRRDLPRDLVDELGHHALGIAVAGATRVHARRGNAQTGHECGGRTGRDDRRAIGQQGQRGVHRVHHTQEVGVDHVGPGL